MPKGKKGRKKDKGAHKKISKSKRLAFKKEEFEEKALGRVVCNSPVIKEVFLRYFRILFTDLVKQMGKTVIADGLVLTQNNVASLKFEDLDAASLEPGIFSKVKLDSHRVCYDVFRFALDSILGLLIEDETKNVIMICETFHTIIYRSLLLDPDFFNINFELVELVVSRITPDTPHGLWLLNILFGFMEMMQTVPDFSDERQKSILNQLHIQLSSKPASSFFNLNVIINGLSFFLQARGTYKELFDLYGKDSQGLNLFDQIFKLQDLNFEILKDAPFSEEDFGSGRHLLRLVIYNHKSKLSLKYSDDLYESLVKAIKTASNKTIDFQNYLLNCLMDNLEISKALYFTKFDGAGFKAQSESLDATTSGEGVEFLEEIMKTDNLKKHGFWEGKSEGYAYKCLLCSVIFDRILDWSDSVSNKFDLDDHNVSAVQFNAVSEFWLSAIFIQQRRFGCEALYQKFIEIIDKDSNQKFFSENIRALFLSLRMEVENFKSLPPESLNARKSITDTKSVIQEHYKLYKTQMANSARFALKLSSVGIEDPHCGGFGRVLVIMDAIINNSMPIKYGIISNIASYLDHDSRKSLETEFNILYAGSSSDHTSALMKLTLSRLDISEMTLHRTAKIMSQYGKVLSDTSLIGIEKVYSKAHKFVTDFNFLTLTPLRFNPDIYDLKLDDPKDGEGWKVLLGLSSMCIPRCVGTGWVLLSMLCSLNQRSHRLPKQQYCDLIFTIYERMIENPVPPNIFNEVLHFLRHLNQVYFQRDDPYFDPVEVKIGRKNLLQYFFEFLFANSQNFKSYRDAGILNQEEINALLNLLLPLDIGVDVFVSYVSDAFTSALTSIYSNGKDVDILAVISFIAEYHNNIMGMFLSVQADLIHNRKTYEYSRLDRVQQKLYIINRDKNIKMVQAKFNYFYWSLLHIFVSTLSIDNISRDVFKYFQITLDRSLLWIKPNSKKFFDLVFDMAFDVALDRAQFDRVNLIQTVKPALLGNRLLMEQLRKLADLGIVAGSAEVFSLVKGIVKRTQVIVNIELVKSSRKVEDEFVALFGNIFVFSLAQAKSLREKLLSYLRENDYLESLFGQANFLLEFKKITGCLSLEDLDFGDDLAVGPGSGSDGVPRKAKEVRSIAKKVSKLVKPFDSPCDISCDSSAAFFKEPLIFEYFKGCILDDFVNRLNKDKSFKKLKQLSLDYRIFIKGKVAVFPNLPINDVDLLLVPKSLSAQKKHYPDLSLSEVELQYKVSQKCIDDSSRIQKILGDTPTENSALDPKLYEVFLSLPGETNYVRYHGFVNQWMMLLGKPVDIEVSYHHDSKDFLQKLLMLNYLSVCSGLRELKINISTNECSVGDVLYPKKTQENLPKDSKRLKQFPFLYIGYNDNPMQEGNRHALGQLLKKNIELFEREDLNGFIDWSNAQPLYDLLGKECKFLDKKPKGELVKES